MVEAGSMAAVGWLVVTLAAVAALANQVVRFFQNFKEQPPARETYATKTEVSALRAETRAELAALKQGLEKMREDIKGDWTRVMDAGEHRAVALHNRINEINEEMPSRLVALLRNTGAIK